MWHLQEMHKKKHWRQHYSSVVTSNANTHCPKIIPKNVIKNNQLCEFCEPETGVSNTSLSTSLEDHCQQSDYRTQNPINWAILLKKR